MFIKSLTTNAEEEIKYNLDGNEDLKHSFMICDALARFDNKISSLFLHFNTIAIFT